VTTPSLPSRALDEAIARLMRPLFRLLLRHGVPFGAFEELAKRTYVDVAFTEFGIGGKRPSASRVSILSGLTRKEVQRLAHEPLVPESDAGARYNRAARVLTGWLRDRDFCDAGGQPLALDPEGDLGFAGLVKRHSGDVPSRAILDELQRVGAVQQLADGRIELLARAYVPRQSANDKLHILGTDVADLISTIDHNLEHGDTLPRFQRKVLYHSVPDAAVPAFRTLAERESQALLERLDAWLAERDTPNPPDRPDLPRARVGLGIYAIEQTLARNPSHS
jgi:hypothetical protein